MQHQQDTPQCRPMASHPALRLLQYPAAASASVRASSVEIVQALSAANRAPRQPTAGPAYAAVGAHRGEYVDVSRVRPESQRPVGRQSVSQSVQAPPVVPVAVDYTGLTVVKLKVLCDERGVEVDKRARKADIIAALQRSDTGGSSSSSKKKARVEEIESDEEDTPAAKKRVVVKRNSNVVVKKKKEAPSPPQKKVTGKRNKEEDEPSIAKRVARRHKA